MTYTRQAFRRQRGKPITHLVECIAAERPITYQKLSIKITIVLKAIRPLKQGATNMKEFKGKKIVRCRVTHFLDTRWHQFFSSLPT